MKLNARNVTFAICTGAVAILFGGALSAVDSRPAGATPKYTADTGLPCGRCHQSPAGGALKPFGEEFKANGYKVKK
jgi:hypothetical protein